MDLDQALQEMLFARGALRAHEALARGDSSQWQLYLAGAQADDSTLRVLADARRASLTTDAERATHDAIELEERALREATIALLGDLGAARGW